MKVLYWRTEALRFHLRKLSWRNSKKDNISKYFIDAPFQYFAKSSARKLYGFLFPYNNFPRREMSYLEVSLCNHMKKTTQAVVSQTYK